MSKSFTEKLLLLLVSSLLAPMIILFANSQYTARQKIIEEERSRKNQEISQENSRNEAILRAQATLLKDFSEVALTWQSLALDVTWFGSDVNNIDLQSRAAERYNFRIVDAWAKYRVLRSQARFLASPDIAKKMLDLEGSMAKQDTAIMTLYNSAAPSADKWKALHNENLAVLRRIEDTIAELAIDLRLTKEHFAR